MTILLRWRSLLICTLLATITWFICYIHVLYHVASIENNWPRYKQCLRQSSLAHIQTEFNLIERNSYSLAERLIANKELLKAIQEDDQQTIFKVLLEFQPYDKRDRGMAIFNRKGRRIAWKNWTQAPYLATIDKCLEGQKFSDVIYTEDEIRMALSSLVPVQIGDRVLGAVVVTTPLDAHEAVRSYTQGYSFSEEMAQLPALQEVKTYFGKAIPQGYSLLDLRGNVLGNVTFTIAPKESIIAAIYRNSQFASKCVIGTLLMAALVFLLGKIAYSSQSSVRKCIYGTVVIATARYSLVFFNFFHYLVPQTLADPNVFSSLGAFENLAFMSFGDMAATLIDLLLTSLALLAITVFLYKWLPPISFAGKNTGRRVVVKHILFIAILTTSFALGVRSLYFFIHTVIQNSGFQFSTSDLMPSLQNSSIYTAILLSSLSFLFAYTILLRLSLSTKERKSLYVTISFLAILLSLALNSDLFPSSITLLLNTLALWFACLLFFTGSPLLRSIHRLSVFGLLCLSLYPVIYQEHTMKKRILVEDQIEEYDNETTSYVLAESIESLQTSPIAIAAIQEWKDNAAFLIWAGNKFLRTLRNLEIHVYKKIVNAETADELEKSRFVRFSQKASYYQLSKFSLNMPTQYSYKTLFRYLNPRKKKLIPYVSVYAATEEERSTLFNLATAPIIADGENIGFVMIVNRLPSPAQDISLTEIFSQQPKFYPSLQAYFDQYALRESNVPYLPKTFTPTPHVVEQVENTGKYWRQESFNGKLYDCLYFRYTPQKWVTRQEEEMLVPQKRIGLLGYPLPSGLIIVFYFFQFFLTGVILLFLPVLAVYGVFRLVYNPPFKNFFSFEHKLLVSFFIVSAVPVFFMGVLSKEHAVKQIWERHTLSLTEYLNAADNALRSQRDLVPVVPEEETNLNDDFCIGWGKLNNNRILHIFLAETIHATNRRDLFQMEILSDDLPGEVYYRLVLLKQDIFIDPNLKRSHPFIIGYKALVSPQDSRQIVGVLALPIVYKRAEVSQEVAKMIFTIFAVYSLLFLVVFIVGMMLAYQITRPLANLIQGIQRVSSGDLEVEIPVYSNDEIGQLVEAFNHMAKDLKVSRDKLVQAEKNAAWREMARQIAHEIKNPLTPMKLSAQHILRAHQDRSQKFSFILDKGLHTIIQSIDSLAKTASTFSEFARFVKPNLKECDLTVVVRECFELFSHYEEEGISITADLSSQIPLVYADSHQVRRVVINLLTNAVQALEENGKGNICVRCFYIEEEKMVCVEVKDDGCGIDEDAKPQLFEPNFSTKSHGSGLGLAICKRAIDRMAGEIGISSEKGVGTRVFFKLPVWRESKK